MRVYTKCPIKQDVARGVWKHFTRKHAQEPQKLWKMPQCFRKTATREGFWGLWIADYGSHRDYYDPKEVLNKPRSGNLFAFLAEQTTLQTLGDEK